MSNNERIYRIDQLLNDRKVVSFQDLIDHKGMIKEPFEARFEAANLLSKLAEVELQRLFPDFSQQYEAQKEVF